MPPNAAIIACLCTLPGGAVYADPLTQPPAMDRGLWQWTTTVISGARSPSPAQLAQLPEPVRAAVQAHTRTALLPRTSQGCLTTDKLRAGFNLVHRAQDKCTFHVNATSASALDETSVCASNYFGDIISHIVFTVQEPDNLSGTIEIHSTHEPAPEIIKLQGKRLGADCGDVVP